MCLRLGENVFVLEAFAMKLKQQTTLRESISVSGIGVHSGSGVKLTLHPAEANHGIVFLRTNCADGRERLIPADYRSVSATELCTVIGEGQTGGVSTIEHVMAALRALGVDNAVVEVDGFEVPILDGSAADFIDAIDQVGIVSQNASRRYVKVLRPVRITQGRGFSELLPRESGFQLDVEIDFPTPIIGRQRKVVELTPKVFREEISRARTFGFVSDVERLWKMGFALGSSLENSVAIGDDGIINPEGLRYKDEFVSHKMLDAVGDLALAGLPLIGTYRSYCGGHRMNLSVLEALFSDRENYAVIEDGVRREPAFAEAHGNLAVALYAPERR